MEDFYTDQFGQHRQSFLFKKLNSTCPFDDVARYNR